MNCDECKEQLLDLIEREAVDPEGVRGVLARCPECRAAFDELKATLALTDALPLEEPPVALDAPVLRAARARATQVVPLKKRRLQPPPWAMAAIALLAVGLGVWTIPGEVQFEGEGDLPVQAPAEEAVAKQTYAEQKSDSQEALREETLADDEDAFAGRVAAAGGSATLNAPAAALERAEPRRKKGAARSRRAQRRSPSSSSELGAAAPATVATADMRVTAAEESASEAQTAKASVPQKKKELAEDGDLAPTCKQRVDEHERRAGAEEDYARTPEDELAIGRCYLKLDNPAAARTWLERAAAHRETRARAESALRALGHE